MRRAGVIWRHDQLTERFSPSLQVYYTQNIILPPSTVAYIEATYILHNATVATAVATHPHLIYVAFAPLDLSLLSIVPPPGGSKDMLDVSTGYA